MFGFAVVLAGSLVLWRTAIRDDVSAGVSRRSEPVAPRAESPRAPETAANPSVEPPPGSAGSAASPRAPAASPRPMIASAGGGPAEEVELDAKGNPIPVATLPTLRRVAATTDDLARACLAKFGTTASGKVTVSYVVARKVEAGESIIATESSNAEDDGTTIDNPELVECLHKTAFAMKFPPAKSSLAVVAKRRFVIEKGVLAESLVLQFSRIP